MRVLRSTLWRTPSDPGMITVIRDCDVKDTLESVRISTTELMNRQGVLVLTDLFDMEDGSIQDATLQAGRRTRDVTEKERNQALLYYWTVDHWRPLKPGGMVISNRPAPLSVDEVRAVLAQLVLHPDYQNYGHVTPTQDGTLVRLRDGKLEST